jgi:hypothetical protein
MNPYAPPQQLAYPPAPAGPPGLDEQQARSKLMVPGIAIAILASILILVFILDLVMAATGNFGSTGRSSPLSSSGMDAFTGPAFLIGVCIFAMLMNGFVLFSMIQMLRLRTWGLALAGCIVTIIPLSSSACCLLTMPFAIWAIVVLVKPEVKAAFR